MEVIVTEEKNRAGLTANDNTFYLDIEDLKIVAQVTRLKYYPDDWAGRSSITLGTFDNKVIAKIEVYHMKPWIYKNTLWDYIEDMGQQIIAMIFITG